MAYLLVEEKVGLEVDAAVEKLLLQGMHAGLLEEAEVLQGAVLEATCMPVAVLLLTRSSESQRPSVACGILARCVPYCDSSCRSPLPPPLSLHLLTAWVGSAHMLLEQVQEQVG